MTALILRYGHPTALPIDILLSAIPSLPRVALDRLVERAIEEMDQQDGDHDLEDDDPSGDTLDEHGERASDDGQPLMRMKPVYAVDQAAGPINEAEAYEHWHRWMNGDRTGQPEFDR